MAATDSTSQPELHDNETPDFHNQNPNPTESQHFETHDPPNPQSETLETLNQDIQNPQQSDKEEETMMILDDEVRHSPPKNVHQSGTITSSVTTYRTFNKRKSRKIYNRKKPTKKFQTLTDHINPIPFISTKSLDFVKHHDVLQRLGLLEFSKIEFDRTIRKDLIVQLILSYDIKKRCSYVNGFRININRAVLARALKLPLAKQDKGSSGVDEVDLDSKVFSDEAIGFIEDFVYNWMLLHEESWVMPQEILNWTRCIRDGHPEKLDSASLIWYKVEKELTLGDKLVDCYYASHLQYLIWLQRPGLFVENDDGVVADYGEENVKADEEREEKEEKEEKKENVSVVQEHDIESTLGPDVEEIVHEEVKKDDDVMVDAEECKVEEVLGEAAVMPEEEMDLVAAEEVEAVKEEQGNLALNLKNTLDVHFLQRCQSSDLNNYEEKKIEEVGDEQIEQVDVDDDEEEEEEEEGGERADEGYDMKANDDSLDRDGMTGNFLQGVETSHIPFNSHGMSSMDLFGSRDGSFMSPGGPFFNNGSKRVMEPDEEDIHHLDGTNKRLKTNQIWDKKPNDFNICMDQIQQWMEKAKMIHESKEQNYENLQYNHQSEMNQLQERRNVLEIIIKSRDEELGKKNTEVFRLERELYMMSDLLQGYRKALNDTRLKFFEYRKRYPLKEEPLYKDAGPGGLVLSTREIEKQRLKQEEDMVKFGIMAKNLEEQFVYQFKMHDDKVLLMADKLVSIGNEVKKLKEIAKQCKETQKPLDELELSVKNEENQKSLDINELCPEPEENQKSLDANESAEPEENEKSLGENELSAEPEENEKSLGENELSAEPEENEKSLGENELSAEPEEIQKDEEDKVLENDATMESVPLDANESKEKDCDEDSIGEER